jgi:hypothetical protein
MYQLSYQPVVRAFPSYGFCMILSVISAYFNSITQLIFVMVKSGVLFEVRTEFLTSCRRAWALKA